MSGHPRLVLTPASEHPSFRAALIHFEPVAGSRACPTAAANHADWAHAPKK
eukprot:CAMPEP_0170244904 /NCGR_PEP_ID=MMETSP0116_2-20130129/22233_1 /TAXON_ID=400756 /ORGANISM="Durinskia baltica, Strain CSIRO CS-38" /LENGTH=50 /DNA_ID=CAMNT_0010495769 /DNA_START=189 /DNA_END=339 /DNA_ORIENTATION=-